MRPLIVICVLLAASFSVAHAQSLTVHQQQRRDASLIEEFSFLIKDFRMDHQTQTNNLNISISYRYIVNIRKSEYPDFRGLAKDVETLLANYPNKDDYWEIVNKQITALLLNKYPGLMSVTIDLKVDPSSLIPYTRSSRVTRERAATRSNRKRT
ncbi:MAG TPA: hypothetical protein VGC73_00705 [Pyrinomonadaceae bacterium]